MRKVALFLVLILGGMMAQPLTVSAQDAKSAVQCGVNEAVGIQQTG